METELVMVKERETKGAVLYNAKDLAGKEIAPTQYFRKTAFEGGSIPDEITVTIKWE